MKNIFIIILFTISFLCKFSLAQSQKDTVLNKNKLLAFSAVTFVSYTGTMVGLNQLWYKNYAHSDFHFFDDSEEWLQMDKFGHTFSSYYLSNILSKGFTWSGMKRNNSVILGSGVAFLAMTSIEVFDGFSTKWGASWTDGAANLGGGILYAGQELLWKKQIVRLKFSFHQTGWAKYRTDALGENFPQQILKDYNGQTYWLSGNIHSLTGIEKMPKWLNIAVGYSGEVMLGGNNNDDVNKEFNISLPDRYRQYYFSLDADLSKIKVKSRFLKSIFKAVNCIKIPFPALVLEKQKLGFKPLYF